MISTREEKEYSFPADYSIHSITLLENDDRVAFALKGDEQVLLHDTKEKCVAHKLGKEGNWCGHVFALDLKTILLWKDYDTNVKVVDLESGKVTAKFDTKFKIQQMTKLANGNVAISVTDIGVKSFMQLWHFKEKNSPKMIEEQSTPEVAYQENPLFNRHTPSCDDLITAIDGRHLIESHSSGQIYIWDTQNKLSVKSVVHGETTYPRLDYRYEKGDVQRLIESSDSISLAMTSKGILYAASLYGHMDIWDLRDISKPALIRRLDTKKGWATWDLFLSPDERFLVSRVHLGSTNIYGNWLWDLTNNLQPRLVEAVTSIEKEHRIISFNSKGQLISNNNEVLNIFTQLVGYVPYDKDTDLTSVDKQVQTFLKAQAAFMAFYPDDDNWDKRNQKREIDRQFQDMIEKLFPSQKVQDLVSISVLTAKDSASLYAPKSTAPQPHVTELKENKFSL